MRYRAVVVAAIVAAALAPAGARGAGYSIYEQGAAALGMAGAGAAVAHDASALFYSPAGIAALGGTRLYLGASALNPVISFAGAAPTPGYGVVEEMTRQTFVPPNLYLTHRVDPRWTLGLGVASPYGLGIAWQNPDRFTGRAITTQADIRTLDVGVTAAYAIGRRWALAAGPDAWWANADLSNRLFATRPIPGGSGAPEIASARLESDRHATAGWHAGASFAPTARWRFGATYRSAAVVRVDGTLTVTQIPYTGGAPGFNQQYNDSVKAALPPTQDASTVLRMPASWALGAAFDPVPAWTVALDADWFQWSIFRDLPLRLHTTPSADRTLTEDYDDAWQVRVGAEHRLPAFTYRLGYYFDRAAAPVQSVTPILPDASRHGVTLGLGLAFGPARAWTLDVYELALFVQRRSTDGRNRDHYDGEYKSFVNGAGIDLGYRW